MPIKGRQTMFGINQENYYWIYINFMPHKEKEGKRNKERKKERKKETEKYKKKNENQTT